jgi:hypothetical protein
MSADIVARLRANARFFNLVKLGSRATIEPEFCKETAEWFTEAADEIDRQRNALAARCGDARPGAHTAGPSETFIPEAL